MAKFLKQLRLDETQLPTCDRTPPRTPKTPCSPFELNVNYFCFRKALGPPKSVIYQPEGHPKQAVIDGEIWPPIFKARHVRSAKRMNIEDTDIFISTYPKCGTTWLQHICHQLVRGDDYHPGAGNEMCIQSPMIERMGGQFATTVPHPRILKTHFSHNNVPWSKKAKYIYCVRNPKDCCTSYFHHNRNFKIYNYASGDFNTFVDLFLNGQLAFGDYFDHLLTWLPHIDEPHVLFLKYEDMVADLEGSVHKIGEFLGGNALATVEDPALLRQVVENSSIEAMKKDQQRWFPEKQLHKSEFIRKGGSRDWKNYFTREQSDRMDALFRTRFAGTAAENWWTYEMAWELPKLPLSGTSALLAQLDLDDDLESASRRGSFSASSDIKDPIPFRGRGERRSSYTSLLSAGYGSIWSLNNVHNA